MFFWIKLALIGLAIVAVLTFIHHEWDTRIAEPYRIEGQEQQKALDLPVLNLAKKEAQDAKDDFNSYKEKCDKQSAEIDHWKGEAAQNKQDAERARADAARARAASASYISDLEKRAAAAPKLQSCPAEQALTRCILSNQLRKSRGEDPATFTACQ